MAENKKKCFNKKHKDIDAISFCQDCKIFICNKCTTFHQDLYENHKINTMDNHQEIFIDLCKEKNHPLKLEFYCKNHNQLCCAACITKLQAKEYGQHKDCDICIIEDIKEEKKNKLKDNIKYLEDLSNNFTDSIKEIKIIFDKIEERKEQLKLKIQNIFTKIRTALNEREDELLSEVDNKFNENFGNDDIIKESEKLPNKIKISLKKGKLIKDWDDDNKLGSILNDCIDIEENISKINIINDNIKKYKINNDIGIELKIDNEYVDNLLKTIKTLGNINNSSEFDTLILKEKVELNKFLDLLSKEIKINKLKLIYRSSRDGLELKDLNEKINNKANLIFIFLTENSRIFGAFFKAIIIVEHKKIVKDKDSFVFSLNNNKIYRILLPECALLFHDNFPVLIGNNLNFNGFWIEKGKIDDNNLLKKPKVYDFQKNNELTEKTNKLIEFEIFEIN